MHRAKAEPGAGVYIRCPWNAVCCKNGALEQFQEQTHGSICRFEICRRFCAARLGGGPDTTPRGAVVPQEISG